MPRNILTLYLDLEVGVTPVLRDFLETAAEMYELIPEYCPERRELAERLHRLHAELIDHVLICGPTRTMGEKHGQEHRRPETED